MNTDEVLGIQDAVFVLSCSVDDFSGEVLILVSNGFAERIFDGWVVAVDEQTIDELNGKGGFAW